MSGQGQVVIQRGANLLDHLRIEVVISRDDAPLSPAELSDVEPIAAAVEAFYVAHRGAR